MTIVHELSGQWVVHAVGWTLLHFCWQGALVAVALACVLRLLDDSRLRYVAGCVALALMVAMPAATLAHLGMADYRVAVALRNMPVESGSALLVQAGDEVATGPWVVRIAADIDRTLPWVLLAWMAGAVLFLVRLSVGFGVARRMRWVGVEPAPAALQEAFARLKQRMGLLRPVKLLHSALIEVPTVIGWLRPVVLLPVSCFTGLSEAQIEAILCHELAHIQRYDYLVSVCQSFVEALLFYHPAVWWVSRQVRRERECCCDEVAVALGGDVLMYARALKTLEERRSFYPEVALGVNGGVLTMRIKRLLGYTEKSIASQAVSIALLAAIVVTVGAAVGKLAYAQSGDAASTLAATAESAAALEQAKAQVHASEAELQAKLAEVQAVRTRELRKQLAQMDTLSAEMRRQVAEAKEIASDKTRMQEDMQKQAVAMHGLSAEQQKRIEQSMQRMQETMKKMNTAEFQKQTEASAALSREQMAEMQKQMAAARKSMVDSAAMQKQLQAKIDSPEFKKQIADVAREAAKVNTPEFREQLDQAMRMAEKANASATKAQMGQLMAQNELPVQAGISAAGTGGGTGKPISVSATVIQGLAISRPQPVYPEDAKKAAVQGIVVLHALISKAGTVEQLQVVSGPEMLRVSALDAVRQWTYKPYLLNGQPTEVETTINVNYTLVGPAPATEEQGPQDPGSASVTPRRIGGAVSAPTVAYQVSPQYSDQAKKAKFNGMVLLSLVVDAQGQPQNVRMVRGVGMGLDEKAIEAVKQYKFKPAMEAGEPVPVQLNIEVNFKIF
jgi:TonB family protein